MDAAAFEDLAQAAELLGDVVSDADAHERVQGARRAELKLIVLGESRRVGRVALYALEHPRAPVHALTTIVLEVFWKGLGR